jgi:hypothetical protein|tara:strand:- start:4292 stop:4495 length:204 start_codon:yes stop_codon:yes gene_type:complete
MSEQKVLGKQKNGVCVDTLMSDKILGAQMTIPRPERGRRLPLWSSRDVASAADRASSGASRIASSMS